MVPVPKFKVWDKQEKRWVCGFVITQDGQLCRPQYFLDGGDISMEYWSQRYIACFSLRLKDKKGKEIFEAHIVRYSDPDNKRDTGIKVAEWHEGYNNLADACHGCTLAFEEYDYEIIGNKFENPELLKGESSGSEVPSVEQG